ncbi:MAG: DNA repair protein RecO [Alphaproteobacteria bacterium]|nr:DNA repair protein RecO [Alphaproteobacteria bacterium]MBU0795971.1 DNA repair protein RecO [Alphaproteobacteria bacterium]MBU0885659.1 DNA repair protein RecO [Alphaproteobacteria bacterium]MBU1812685.1 DNA repair protein RecO [Alphaproteobacteria bacterium]
MDWTDDGIVLGARPYGEGSIIVSLLTRERGRHAGLVRGGASGRSRGLYQPGNFVRASWRARLSEHLGNFTCEMLTAQAAGYMDDPVKLAALSSACAVADGSLPEREPHPAVYEGLLALIELLDSDVWPAAYVKWEIGVLADLGFGLDLSRCAATGLNDQLAYVSPRTGRAVSLSAGEPYRDRMLKLPGFLIGRGSYQTTDILDGLEMTGHFLDRHVFGLQNQPLPAARTRFIDRLKQSATISGGGNSE